jgi:molybdate transport system substrate-binding protein
MLEPRSTFRALACRSAWPGLATMHAQLPTATGVVFALAAILSMPTASSAQVRVLMSAGFSAAYRELLPELERTAGAKITTTTGGSVGTGPNTIGAQLRRGVPADLVILAREGLSELIAEGRVVTGTDIDLARSTIGLIVRAGAPKPDISTTEAFKQALLRAKSVAVSTSTSGVYLTTQLFPRLGIADQMAGKTLTSGSAAVGRGEAEIGLQQVSEVLQVQGADFVGAIPADVQYVTVYAAAVVAGSKEVAASRRLIAFLASEAAMQAIKTSGMEPSRRQ